MNSVCSKRGSYFHYGFIDLSSVPRSHMKDGGCDVHAGDAEEPWGLLAKQCSLIGQLLANERFCPKGGRQHLRRCPHAQACIRAQDHTQTHTRSRTHRDSF